MVQVFHLSLLAAVVLAAVMVYTWFVGWNREQREIRRERRTGLTPPDGSTPPEYRVPVAWIHAAQKSDSEIVVKMDQMLSALRRIEDLLVDRQT